MLKTHLIAWTTVDPEAMFEASGGAWELQDATAADALGEFAGRGCYQSWRRPNPETATTEGYLGNIIDQRHFSIFRHASMTLYVTGVSRSLTHELVVHKHLAHSQLSQRYVVPAEGDLPVLPPLVAQDQGATWLLQQWHALAGDAYGRLLKRLETRFPDAKPKEIREAARAVLPNAQETKLTVTGNLQAWRQFVTMRHSVHADAEIREFARQVLGHLRHVAPASVQDIPEVPFGTGREIDQPWMESYQAKDLILAALRETGWSDDAAQDLLDIIQEP